jgi:hypothetical protein
MSPLRRDPERFISKDAERGYSENRRKRARGAQRRIEVEGRGFRNASQVLKAEGCRVKELAFPPCAKYFSSSVLYFHRELR